MFSKQEMERAYKGPCCTSELICCNMHCMFVVKEVFGGEHVKYSHTMLSLAKNVYI